MIGLEPIHLTIGNRGVKLGAPGVTRTLKHSILNRAAYTNSATGAWCWSRELNPDYQRFRPWRCTNSLLQQELGARPRSRTGRFYGLNVASLPIPLVAHGAQGGSRIPKLNLLKVASLPIPLLGRNFWWVPQDLNLQCLRGDPVLQTGAAKPYPPDTQKQIRLSKTLAEEVGVGPTSQVALY